MAEQVLTELCSSTEQSDEGPGCPGGITRSVTATQQSIRKSALGGKTLTESLTLKTSIQVRGRYGGREGGGGSKSLIA